MSEKENKCENCLFKKIMEEETEKTKKAQEYFLTQVKKVNETLAKYTQELEKLGKKK